MANLKFPRATDKKVIQVFSTMCELMQLESVRINLGGNVSLGTVSVKSSDATLNQIIERDGFIIDQVKLSCFGFSVTFFRGGQVEPKSWITDEIALNNDNNANSETEEKKVQIILAIDRLLVTSHGINENSNQSINDSIIAVHHSTLDRLESLNAELVRTTTALQVKILEDARNQAEKNDSILQEKIEENITVFKEKEELLEKQKEALRKRETDLDDRGNTHARRELRSNMLDEVKARVASFGVSNATVNKRKPVQIGIYLLLVILLVFAALSIFELISFSSDKQLMYRSEINRPDPSNATAYAAYSEYVSKMAIERYPESHYYALLARVAILTTLIFTTLLFYIKWQNKWAEHHAEKEFQLQRFQLDISRANWFIETCLEWKKETDSEIPTELIDKMTKGLFQTDQDGFGAVIHPADELASALFGSASKIKVKVGENEVEINPKKIPKQVASRADDSE